MKALWIIAIVVVSGTFLVFSSYQRVTQVDLYSGTHRQFVVFGVPLSSANGPSIGPKTEWVTAYSEGLGGGKAHHRFAGTRSLHLVIRDSMDLMELTPKQQDLVAQRLGELIKEHGPSLFPLTDLKQTTLRLQLDGETTVTLWPLQED